jgi:uracil DNA glycosylase superfamily protein
MTFGEQTINFNQALNGNFKLPQNVCLLKPFKDQHVLNAGSEFYKRFYGDNHSRIFIFGINPGRFGAGITGIPFTDPIRLEKECGIVNDFKKRPELSSVFIYNMIAAFGGKEKFYGQYYITAVCPIGFTCLGKNMNYYDDKKLYADAKQFIVDSIKKQLRFGAETDFCICLGEGKNFDCLSEINEENKFFKEIIPLPHPRWIMQYRRKSMEDFIKKYLNALR